MSDAAVAHSGGFVLRTPLLPWATLESLFADLDVTPALAGAGDVDEAAIDAAAERDAERITERLRVLLADPVVREALFLASPSLSERIDRWLAGDDPEAEATRRSLLLYVSRMAARATPFGLFAGLAFGEVVNSPSSRLDVAERPGLRRHTRLDYGFLAGVVAGIEADPQNWGALRFFPNSSLYRAGGRLRMTERQIDRGRVRYHRVTFEEDDALATALERAKDGATVEEIAAALVDDDITLQDALEYVGELVGSQVVVSDLGPAVTGPDPVPAIVQRLAAHPSTAMVADELAHAADAVAALDAGGPGADPAAYRQVADRLRKIEPDLDPAKLFQVDLTKPGTTPTLGRDVIAEVERAVALLRRIAPSGDAEDLQQFRTAFSSRYEHREVPLLEALDEEIGVGFGPPQNPASDGKPLLAGFAVRGLRSDAGATFRGADHARLKLLVGVAATGAREIELTDDDVRGLEAATPRVIPDALSCSGTVVAASPQAMEAGEFRLHVHGMFGPSGARVLGRFAHTDERIEALVRRHVADEEAARPNALFAEIVHLPEGRMGNVIARPVLRGHEIPVLGQSGAPREHHLPLDDLLVSVRDGRIVLRSARRGAEVVPRLTNAHNFRLNSIAPYRFLAALQAEGVDQGMGWSWGAMSGLPFLPRVVYGRLLLARAQWTLVPTDIAPLVKAKGAARYRYAQELRERLGLPRWVAVAGGDNELPVDLESVAGCDLLAHEAKRKTVVLLKEILNGPAGSPVSGPGGLFNHEFLLPLVRVADGAREHAEPRRATATAVAPPEGFETSFPPGSTWLSVYLETGKATADALLCELVRPLVAEVLDRGDADGWFFIRYGDPWHIRLRFRGDPSRLAGNVLPLLRSRAATFLTDGRLAGISVHTYDREIERYGGPHAIAIAEELFRADSDAAIDLVAATRSDDGLDARWRLALAASDRLLADLGLDVAERQRFARSCRDGFAAEPGADGGAVKQFAGQLFRRERAALEALLEQTTTDPLLRHGLAIVDRRSAAIRPLLTSLRELDQVGLLVTQPEHVARSLIHMQDNRILRGAQRLQEFVMYDLLDRVYSAQLGRQRARS
ncbi:MAG TPA: lantibiotic dehydratase [Acidimicrobiales bacterium]